jgi:hypothetical protein
LVYSSPDLSSGSWKLEQQVYPGGNAGFPECTYFRSQAVYNAATDKYVLWANAVGCDEETCPHKRCYSYAIGTAPAPGGPFTFAGMAEAPAAALPPTSGYQGDYALFVDDAAGSGDGSGYIILTHGIAGAGHRDMFVFKLTPDFLGFDADTPSSGILPGPHLVEAPAMFQRGSTYYAFLGGCTCMGLYGGGVAVLTAPHPLGPWTNVTATLDPGCPMMEQTTCFEMGPGQVCNPVTQAQQNFVIEVPLAGAGDDYGGGEGGGGGGSAWVWTGDKWQQSPDDDYDEQPQTWLPLEWDSDGQLLPLRYVDNFTLDVAV